MKERVSNLQNYVVKQSLLLMTQVLWANASLHVAYSFTPLPIPKVSLPKSMPPQRKDEFEPEILINETMIEIFLATMSCDYQIELQMCERITYI